MMPEFPTLEMKPACAEGYDPDLWFPEAPPRTTETKKFTNQQTTAALKVCSICPVREACLRFALSDPDAISYGIYGGTLAFERLEQGDAKSKPSIAHNYQRNIREYALKTQGLGCPPIPQDVPSPRFTPAAVKPHEEQREAWRAMKQKHRHKKLKPVHS
jgi:hypothetical protein